MEDIGAGDGNVDVDFVGFGLGRLGGVAHLAEHLADLFARQLKATDGVDEAGAGLRGAGLQVWGFAGFVVVRRNDADGLDGVGLAAVRGEHGDKDLADNLQLGLVGGGDVDEDVCRVEGDLGVVAVDDGRHRQDCAVGIVDDGVDGFVPDDWQVLLELQIFL